MFTDEAPEEKIREIEHILFSTERVNMATMTPDITTFYGWASEIENIELN